MGPLIPALFGSWIMSLAYLGRLIGQGQGGHQGHVDHINGLGEEFAPSESRIRGFTRDCERLRDMFAVEGWKLAGVVAQTNVSKKKLKRKRDEANEPAAAKKDEGKAKEQRVNPFALGNVQSTKGTVGSKPQKMIQSVEDSKAAKDETVATAPTISDRQKARNRAKKRAQRKVVNASTTEDPLPIEPTISKQIPKISPSATSIPTLTPLQQKMRAKLSGSQFRQINEKLYTTHSSEALSLFTEQPSLFHDVSSHPS
jgi:ribosomal RNA-processing protein 8